MVNSIGSDRSINVGFFMGINHHDHEEHGHIHHGSAMVGELICHLPYAIASVAFALSISSFLAYFADILKVEQVTMCRSSDVLFHSFHFMHIAFAATGTVITYLRFSKSFIKALIVGIITPTIFCTLSDSILPYLGGRLLGVDMHFHLCFVSELYNVLPFLFVGLLNGFVMSMHHSSRQAVFSVYSHFVHILVSSFAALFFLISHGCIDWYERIGIIFLFLIFAVVIPCTLSDVVIPMKVAEADEKH
jgi:hypothetical protein